MDVTWVTETHCSLLQWFPQDTSELTEEKEFKIAAIQMENNCWTTTRYNTNKDDRIAIVEQENLHILSSTKKSIMIQMIAPVKSEPHFLGVCPLCWFEAIWENNIQLSPIWKTKEQTPWEELHSHPPSNSSPEQTDLTSAAKQYILFTKWKEDTRENVASNSLLLGCFSCQNTVQCPCNTGTGLESSDPRSRLPSHAKPEPKTWWASHLLCLPT